MFLFLIIISSSKLVSISNSLMLTKFYSSDIRLHHLRESLPRIYYVYSLDLYVISVFFL